IDAAARAEATRLAARAEADAIRLKAAADQDVQDAFAREMEMRRNEVERIAAYGNKTVFVGSGAGAGGDAMAMGFAAGMGSGMRGGWDGQQQQQQRQAGLSVETHIVLVLERIHMLREPLAVLLGGPIIIFRGSPMIKLDAQKFKRTHSLRSDTSLHDRANGVDAEARAEDEEQPPEVRARGAQVRKVPVPFEVDRPEREDSEVDEVVDRWDEEWELQWEGWVRS
ncbi:hypothetical protein FRB90_000326, partial [Tulasnella sp. 427]